MWLWAHWWSHEWGWCNAEADAFCFVRCGPRRDHQDGVDASLYFNIHVSKLGGVRKDDESGKVERQAGTYKNRFLSHQDGGDKVRYPRINLAEVTRLTAAL